MLSLVCHANGSPKPSISWFHDTGTSLITVPRRHISVNRIRKTADISDSGKYICKATNTEGSRQMEYTVNVAYRYIYDSFANYNYGPCSVSCGLGQKIKTRMCIREDNKSRVPCPAHMKDVEKIFPCHNQACI